MLYEIVKPPSKPWLESLTYNAFLSCRGNTPPGEEIRDE